MYNSVKSKLIKVIPIVSLKCLAFNTNHVTYKHMSYGAVRHGTYMYIDAIDILVF